MPRTVASLAAIVLACCSLTVSGQEVRPDTVLILKSGQEVRGQFVGFRNGLVHPSTARRTNHDSRCRGCRSHAARDGSAGERPAPARPPVAAPPPPQAPAARPPQPLLQPLQRHRPRLARAAGASAALRRARLRPLPPGQRPPRRRPRLPAPISKPRRVGRRTRSSRPSPTRLSIPRPQLLQTRGSSMSFGRAIGGSRIQTRLGVNGVWVGANYGNNYFFVSARSGRALLLFTGVRIAASLALNVEAGKTYYLQQTVTTGMTKSRSEPGHRRPTRTGGRV